MFTLTVVTPEKKLLANQEIEEVFVPGFRGELNILPGHAPLMTTLRPGILRYRLKGESKIHAAAVSVGYAQVNPTGVNVLAETAERPDELDAEIVDVELREATQALTGQNDPKEIEKLQLLVARATARKEVASLGIDS